MRTRTARVSTLSVTPARRSTHSAKYYLTCVTCTNSQFSVRINGEVVNPHGEQLSATEVPLKYLFLVLIVVWLLLAVAWSANWIRFRAQKSKLHRAITVFPAVKVLWAAVCVAAFWSLSATGKYSLASHLPYYIVSPFPTAAFFAIMLLISRGWGIILDNLDRYIVVVVSVVAGVLILQFLGLLFSGFVMLITFIVYLVALFFIFRAVSVSIQMCHLRVQAERSNTVVLSGGKQPPHVVVPNKSALLEAMFRRFRIILFGFVLLTLLLTLLDALLSLTIYGWIANVLQEILLLVAFGLIMWTFRLRPVNIYYRMGLPHEVSAGTVAPADVDAGGMIVVGGAAAASAVPASRSDPLFTVGASRVAAAADVAVTTEAGKAQGGVQPPPGDPPPPYVGNPGTFHRCTAQQAPPSVEMTIIDAGQICPQPEEKQPL
eukprot:TRINITY_DN3679_c0_g1_i5.p1 TRINITY_DN3679_c0_g1~~TRINITY_DN3679_c0_g1_i5.p1  ORF type:complete len:432 (-),score=64.57 TRINITY_DN3679_c0_g1_i5:76-1371(-)